MALRKRIRLGTLRWRVQALASLSGLRIQCCHEPWYRLQTQLRSGIAVAVWCRPAATAPIRPLGWEPPHAASVALKSKILMIIITDRQKLLDSDRGQTGRQTA